MRPLHRLGRLVGVDAPRSEVPHRLGDLVDLLSQLVLHEVDDDLCRVDRGEDRDVDWVRRYGLAGLHQGSEEVVDEAAQDLLKVRALPVQISIVLE